MFPAHISLRKSLVVPSISYKKAWREMMQKECHRHSIWESDFVRALRVQKTMDKQRAFNLARTWSINMVVGSYCFPRYVATLASRAEQDVVRHGLLENAWDESGSFSHTKRSHYWLAVRLARLLGLSDKEIKNIRPLPEAQQYADEHFRHCQSGNFGTALGMICLIEEFTTPEFSALFKTLLDTCEIGLGMKKEDFVLNGGAEYFTANIADDERHREEMPAIVATWLTETGQDLSNEKAVLNALAPVRSGVALSIALRQGFFEGIYKSQP
jgi:pyrroloquinoline quinone (PQQ) biosynthesis protein C